MMKEITEFQSAIGTFQSEVISTTDMVHTVVLVGIGMAIALKVGMAYLNRNSGSYRRYY